LAQAVASWAQEEERQGLLPRATKSKDICDMLTRTARGNAGLHKETVP